MQDMENDVTKTREELGMTRRELADALATHVSTLSRWETGKTTIPARARVSLDLLKASVKPTKRSSAQSGAA